MNCTWNRVYIFPKQKILLTGDKHYVTSREKVFFVDYLAIKYDPMNTVDKWKGRKHSPTKGITHTALKLGEK